MGRLIALITLILSNAVYAAMPEDNVSGSRHSTKLDISSGAQVPVPTTTSAQFHLIPSERQFNDSSPVYFKSEMNQIFAKVDPRRETIVITANMINRNAVYGGKFSPTATAFLKPLNGAPMRGFVQVRCIDVMCNNLGVMVGVSTQLGNPSAVSEKRFVLFRNATENLRNRITSAGI